jgi:hypothetical protein
MCLGILVVGYYVFLEVIETAFYAFVIKVIANLF